MSFQKARNSRCQEGGSAVLTLTRKIGERIFITDQENVIVVIIRLVKIDRSWVRLGFVAPQLHIVCDTSGQQIDAGDASGHDLDERFLEANISERFLVGSEIRLVIRRIHPHDEARIGVEAPGDKLIFREEVWLRREAEAKKRRAVAV